jgi:adenine-specific DNA-methyltransferase
MSPEEEAQPDDYIRRQFIPYLGNKRALLPRLSPVFCELAGELSPPKRPDGERLRFLDPFAGTGAVSRLARSLGFYVEANDWEPYSEAVNRCWLTLARNELYEAFGGLHGLRSALAEWNALHPLSPGYGGADYGEPYIARYYAPKNTESPEIGRERLFYTAENARFIDSVRNRIEDEYPAGRAGNDTSAGIRRTVLLGALLFEAAVHTNTSGVFKAYHRGFGGHSGDALKRIMARMELELPILPDAPPALVSRMDAAAFARGRSAELVYIDPPYNQHQYGSNYHLLNTIVAWERKAMPLELGADGQLLRKAGIPEDWTRTRSAYCSRAGAKGALKELIDNVDAPAIVLSWNDAGHLDVEEMAGLLAERGRLEARTLEYQTYRGGRQSDARRMGNREFLFILRTDRPKNGPGAALRSLKEARLLDGALRGNYDPRRLAERFTLSDGSLRLKRPGKEEIRVCFSDYRKIHVSSRGIFDRLEPALRLDLLKGLNACLCQSAQENLDALLPLLRESGAGAKNARREALRYLRKLAHPRYDKDFSRYLALFGALEALQGDAYFLKGLDALKKLAARRYGPGTHSEAR